MPKIKSIVQSTRKGKRYKATLEDGTIIHFGQKDPKYGTFIDHQDEARRQAYIARHSKNNEDWNAPTAGALSRWILWEKPSLREAVKAYNKRFG
jgi:hypothetical protein